MNNIFNKVFIPGVQSSTFDLSNSVNTAFSMGELIPVHVLDTMPGDNFRITPNSLMRFQPLVSPVMHRVRTNLRYFYSPNRIMWSEWDNWISGNSTAAHPFMLVTTIEKNSLMDFLQYPVGDFTSHPGGALKVSVFPIVAYLMVWNEYFMDQNLQTPYDVAVIAGDNSDQFEQWRLAATGVPRVNWGHDYFTASLPFAQKGDAVQVPLTVQQTIPVDYDFRTGGQTQNVGIWRKASDGTQKGGSANVNIAAGPTPLATSSTNIAGDFAAYDPNGTLNVDIQANASDLNDLRTAWTLQAFLERTARVGSRIWEVLRGHFGVNTPDGRIQRPEYKGGITGNMVVSEVLSNAETITSDDTVTSAIGQMAGHGISVSGGNSLTIYCPEHGFVIGFEYVRPDTAYSQGLPKMYSRFARFDYPWPMLANLGEAPVLNKEVYAEGADPDGTFGYMPIYEDQRFRNDVFTGEMRSTLDFWHLGRVFDSNPVLNAEFIECRPSTRIFAVTDESDRHIVAKFSFRVTVNRKLPRNGISSSIQ